MNESEQCTKRHREIRKAVLLMALLMMTATATARADDSASCSPDGGFWSCGGGSDTNVGATAQAIFDYIMSWGSLADLIDVINNNCSTTIGFPGQ